MARSRRSSTSSAPTASAAPSTSKKSGSITTKKTVARKPKNQSLISQNHGKEVGAEQQTQDYRKTDQNKHVNAKKTSPVKQSPPQAGFGRIFLLSTLLALLIATVMLVITAAAIGWWGWNQIKVFTDSAGMSTQELIELGREVRDRELETHYPNRVVVLLLGVDALPERAQAAPLTDTIMLLSINRNTGVITALSLPRDIWSSEYQDKINSLYYYGSVRNPEDPTAFPTQAISDLTGVNIDYTVVLSLDTVAALIDILGGVTVTVETAFIDERYPNEGVDYLSNPSPEIVFRTVEFEAGEQRLTSERALEYIRSRQSNDLSQGSDIARNARQQQVISGLMKELQNIRALAADPAKAGSIWKFYLEHYDSFVPMSDALTIARDLIPVRDVIEITSRPLPIYPDDPDGVIEHPRQTRAQPLWIYQIRDADAFRTTVQAALELESPTSP